MSDKKNKKKSPFSIYWIYAAIGVAIIGVQLFMSSGSDTEIGSQVSQDSKEQRKKLRKLLTS